MAAKPRKPAALVRRDAGAADRDQGQCAAVKGEYAATYRASRRHENTSPESHSSEQVRTDCCLCDRPYQVTNGPGLAVPSGRCLRNFCEHLADTGLELDQFYDLATPRDGIAHCICFFRRHLSKTNSFHRRTDASRRRKIGEASSRERQHLLYRRARRLGLRVGPLVVARLDAKTAVVNNASSGRREGILA